MNIDESLLQPCDRGLDLATGKLAGVPAVSVIDEKDGLLTLCADRQEGLAKAAREATKAAGAK